TARRDRIGVVEMLAFDMACPLLEVRVESKPVTFLSTRFSGLTQISAQKITFPEMRSFGVRSSLVYCAETAESRRSASAQCSRLDRPQGSMGGISGVVVSAATLVAVTLLVLA